MSSRRRDNFKLTFLAKDSGLFPLSLYKLEHEGSAGNDETYSITLEDSSAVELKTTNDCARHE